MYIMEILSSPLKHYYKNRERKLDYQKEYNTKNKERIKAYNKSYYQNVRKHKREYKHRKSREMLLSLLKHSKEMSLIIHFN